MPLNRDQIDELSEYIQELLDLYSEEEYEDYLENIAYHYCNRKYGIDRQSSKELLYDIIKKIEQ